MAEKTIDFAKLRDRCNQVVAEHASRNAMYQAIERMYMMQWDEQPPESYIKATMSPDAHIAITGIGRLLTSTDPVISVARSAEEPGDVARADKLEKVLQALWRRANRARRWPLHYDACKSAALFAEVCIEIANVDETLRWAEVEGRDTTQLKREAKACPYSYNVRHPSTVFPQFGAFGLRSVLHRYRRRLWEVREFWGKNAAVVEGDDMDWVTFSNYWDATYHVVWVNDGDKPVVSEKHGLPFIPWVCVISDGSGMWNEPEKQRNPMLYSVWKGGWWQRQNLLYSVFYTLAAQMGFPTWVITTLDGRDVAIDLNKPGGKVEMRPGESVAPLQKMLIDDAVKQGLAIADSKLISATLPRVVFGESPGSTMSYSAMNLLSQGGRLPLVPIERQVGYALAEMFDVTLRWIHHAGKKVQLYNVGEMAEVAPFDINPDHIEVDVKLKADVPQDRLSLATMIQILRQPGPDGLPIISRNTASDFLGFMQPADEFDQVVNEAFVSKFVQEFIKSGGQPVPQPQQQQAPVGVPPVQMGPPMMPGGGEMGMEQGGMGGVGGGGEY